jgi:serine/threonine protein kinase
MTLPDCLDSFLDLVRKSGLLTDEQLAALDYSELPHDPEAAAEELIRRALLTTFQARHLLAGRFRGLLVDQYRVKRPIGKGGMGLVYLAEHLTLSRQVAIKILRTDLLDSPGVRERFAREGRAIAALNHPNIVRLYDVGTDRNTHYLIMEYVEGRSLEALLRQRGRLPVQEAVGYAVQVAEGLRHAHERGVVHRDIKPANLLLDPAGTIKILDMGLARFHHVDNTDNLTERIGGGILGSPDYIAPEQASQQFDARTDVYSLGATLYALLTGEPPFSGRSIAEKLISHRSLPVIPPHHRNPGIPRELSMVVLRMMAKNPADRYQTPAEVVKALRPFAQEAPEEEPEVRETAPVAADRGASGWKVGLMVMVFLALAAAGVVAAWLALQMLVGRG